MRWARWRCRRRCCRARRSRKAHRRRPPKDTRPTILLILSDGNSVPRDGCHPSRDLAANNITPNFNAFAKQGMCFDRAYSTSPQCASSRGAIFAGCDPLDIGISRFAEPASLDVRYFSDILRSSGYWGALTLPTALLS